MTGAAIRNFVFPTATINISGGTVSAATGNEVISVWAGTVNVSGGTVENTGSGASIHTTSGEINVSGGTVRAATGNAIDVQNAGGLAVISQANDNVPTLITSASTSSSYAVIIVGNNGTATVPRLRITGGTVRNTGDNSNSYAIQNRSTGSVIISGGTVGIMNESGERLHGRAINSQGSSVIFVDNGAEVIANSDDNRFLVSASNNNAMIIEKTDDTDVYNAFSSDELTTHGTDATAMWLNQGGKPGISYARGTTSGFIEIERVTVEKINPDVTFPTSATLTFGETLGEAELSGDEEGDGTFTFLNPIYKPTERIDTKHEMIFTPDNNIDNYNIVIRHVTVIVNRAAGAGTVSVANLIYGEEPNPIPLNGTGTPSFEYKVQGEGDDTYSNVIPTNAGSYTIRATFAESANHLGGHTATDDFTITPKPLTVTGAVHTKEYDGNTSIGVTSITEVTLGGIINNDEVSAETVTAEYTNPNAGTTTINITNVVLTGSAQNNYTVPSQNGVVVTGGITPKAITITNITATNREYNATSSVAITGGTLVGVVSNDDVTPNVPATGTMSNADVDNGKPVTIGTITLTGSASGNYELTQPTATVITVNITPADYTAPVVAGGNIRINVGTGVLPQTVTGVGVNSEPVAGVLAWFSDVGHDIPVEANDLTNIGSKTFYWTFTATNGNYLSTPKTGETVFTLVDKDDISESITFNNDTKIYNGNPQAIGAASVTGNFIDGAFTFSYDYNGAGDTPPTNAGTYTVTVTAENDDYTGTSMATLTINKATLTPSVNFSGVSGKIYDGNTNIIGTQPAITLAGAVNSEHPAATAEFAFTNANAGSNKPVNAVDIALSDSWGDNYQLSVTSLSNVASGLAITAKPITITPTANQSKLYGEADPSFNYTPNPALISDDNFTGALSRVAGVNVGNYNITIGTLSAGSNYILSLYAPPVTFEIRRATFTNPPGASTTARINNIVTYTLSGLLPSLAAGLSYGSTPITYNVGNFSTNNDANIETATQLNGILTITLGDALVGATSVIPITEIGRAHV
jgi:hypothetical protein